MGIFKDANDLDEDIHIECEKVRFLKERKNNAIKKVEGYFDEKIKAVQHEKISSLDEKKLEMIKKLSKASEFDYNLIAPFIAKLISIIEEENYKCYTADYFLTIKYQDAFNPTSNLNETLYLITKEEDVAHEYNDEYSWSNGIPFYNKNCNMILLKSEDKRGFLNEPGKIKFYNNSFYEVVNFKRFTYVYDFINLVIEYKIENDLPNIGEIKLEELLDEFLSDYRKGKGTSKRLNINKNIIK